MRINPKDKMCGNGKMEKHIVRECFESYLPANVAAPERAVLRRRWLQLDRHAKEVAAQQISDQQLETARFRFPYNTPTSKEGYLYREIFEELFRCRAPPNACRAARPSPARPPRPSNGTNRSRRWTILPAAPLACTVPPINNRAAFSPSGPFGPPFVAFSPPTA